MKKKDISLSDITSSPIRSTGMRKPKRKTLRLLQRYRNNAPVGLGRRVLFLGLPTIAAILVVAVLVVQIQIARGQQTDISFERPERSSIEVDILPEQNLGRELNPGELIQLDQEIEADILSEVKEIEITDEAYGESGLPAKPEVTKVEPTKAEQTDPLPTSKPQKVYANAVLNFRASPGTNGAVLGQLMYGEAVTELAKDEGWSYVRTYQGVEGYVKSQYLQDSKPAPKVKANEPAPTKAKTKKTTASETTAKVPEPTSDPNIITTEPPPESLIRYVNVDMANIRTEPNADSVRVGFAQRGTVISLIKVDGEWAEIKTESGLTGYMMTNLFQKQKIAKTENNINMGKDNWVTVSYGYLRAEPSTESEAIGDVRLNEKVYQISTDGIWSKVKLANGNTGYLRNDLLTAVKPEIPPQEEPTAEPAPATQYRDTNVNVYVTVSYANLRESDSTDSSVVGSAVLDEKLTQLSTNGSWSKIKKSNGLVAYISNGIISTTAPGSEETQTEQPAEAAFKEINKKAWVSVYSANVRKEPNTVSSIVTKLGYADSFTRISSNGTWSYIETEDGKKGYMINSLISTKEIQKPEIEPESEDPETDANAAKRRQVVDKAMSALGVRYVFGGSSMNGFDCSGLVMWAYASIGVNLPHSSNTQGQSHVKSIPFSHSDYSNLRLGDLLFFGYSSSRYSHVGIYVGNGKMIHAPRPGAVVRIEGFANRSKPLLKVGRIIN